MVKIFAINDQVIGETLCNPPGPFYYCGNITPSRAPEEITAQARHCCQRLAESLPVQGINGIDFVGAPTGIYFMEVNPRIPGSLAPIEDSLDRPLLDVIFRPPSEVGRLRFMPKYTAVKYILYAPQAILANSQKILRAQSDICDIPTGEQSIEKGEPICTVLTRGSRSIETLERSKHISLDIYRRLLKKQVRAAA